MSDPDHTAPPTPCAGADSVWGIPTAESLYQALLAHVRGWLAAQAQPVQLVGVASGGVWLAQRLQADLGLAGQPGVVSSVMHRDDFAQRGLASSAHTQLGFDVNGAHVLLLDDVLYTGRTLRAVLNELFDHGRPACVYLMVLVNREGRELPVQADWAATRLSLPAHQSLELACNEQGRLSFAVDRIARPE